MIRLRLYAWFLKKILQTKRGKRWMMKNRELAKKANNAIYIVERMNQWDKQKWKDPDIRDADIDILMEFGVIRKEDLK